jgi:hypothetical protein
LLMNVGDEVAVLPSASALPSQVLHLATVRYSGDVYVQLEDGRMFASLGGIGLNTSGCIVPAGEEHRAALRNAIVSDTSEGSTSVRSTTS